MGADVRNRAVSQRIHEYTANFEAVRLHHQVNVIS